MSEFICLNQPSGVCLCEHQAAEHHLGECARCGCDQFFSAALFGRVGEEAEPKNLAGEENSQP